MKRLAIFYVLTDVILILLSMYIYRNDAEHWAHYLFFYTVGMLVTGTFYSLKIRRIREEAEAAKVTES
jgi:hypothetical protein